MIDPKIGHIPAKQAEINQWDMLCVDFIGPYTIHRKEECNNGKKKTDLTLWCVAMIDPVKSWFEIVGMKTKRADIKSNIVETTWLTMYPYSAQAVLDRGT
eukprot:15350757-Ditylum_brightwellii.AAC.1